MSMPRYIEPYQPDNKLLVQSKVITQTQASNAKLTIPYIILIAIIGFALMCYFYIKTANNDEYKEEEQEQENLVKDNNESILTQADWHTKTSFSSTK